MLHLITQGKSEDQTGRKNEVTSSVLGLFTSHPLARYLLCNVWGHPKVIPLWNTSMTAAYFCCSRLAGISPGRDSAPSSNILHAWRETPIRQHGLHKCAHNNVLWHNTFIRGRLVFQVADNNQNFPIWCGNFSFLFNPIKFHRAMVYSLINSPS